MKSYITALHTWYRNTLRHPTYRWWIILGTVAYLVSPFDISPDLFPIVGWIDDTAIVSLLVAELSQMAVSYVKDRNGTKPGMEDESSEEGTVEVNAIPIHD